jgi:putative oxidoreductase
MSFNNQDVGKLILRVTCGGLLILHGSHSLFNGVDHIKVMLANNGIPESIAYLNLIGEVVAPVMMIAGFKARIAGLIIAFNMLMSILIAHRDIMFSRNDFGGWMIELNVFFLFAALAVTFLGAGRYAITKGKWD